MLSMLDALVTTHWTGYALVCLMPWSPGCQPSGTLPEPATPAVRPPKPESTFSAEARSGLRLWVVDAPEGTSLTVHASDDRPPLVPTRPLRAEEHLTIPAGFVTVTLDDGSDPRTLQMYVHPGAELRYSWAAPSSRSGDGIAWLDRAALMQKARANFDALMEAASSASDPDQSGAALEAELQIQREAVESLDEGVESHLLRLCHATNAIQITGPDDAWTVIEPVPADSIAWAAYAGKLLELRALFGAHPQARERFAQVRERVPDLGLTTAFHAGDLYEAMRSGEPDAAAQAYVESTTMTDAPREGNPMPAFEFVDLDTRRPVRSSELLGTPYLLELWSTWCEPCIEQMPELHALHAAAGTGKSPDLRIISVTVNDTRAPVEAFRAERWPMPWTHVWAPNGAPVFEAWSIDSVPYAVLVDAQGVVARAGAHVSLDEARGLTR